MIPERIKSDKFTRSNREKSNIARQYWKNEWLDGNIIFSYFGGSNNIYSFQYTYNHFKNAFLKWSQQYKI